MPEAFPDMRDEVMVFLEPTYEAHLADRFVDPTPEMNPDGLLTPLVRLRETMATRGIEVHTADLLRTGAKRAKRNLYYSFGPLKQPEELQKIPGVELKRAFIFEPPVVYPQLYRSLRSFARYFERIHLFNTHEDGYRVDASTGRKLQAFRCPQPFDGVLEDLWSNRDRRYMTLINSNKSPASHHRELYSERIRAAAYFGRKGKLDLYGRDWADPIAKFIKAGQRNGDFPLLTIARILRRGIFLPYLLNRKALLQAYQGEIQTKHEVLSRYTFAICYENMVMQGYLTEKIFDCLYVGTIPIYWGAPDIDECLPKSCYIDARAFKSYPDLERYLDSLTESQLEAFREEGRAFLTSEAFKPFSTSCFSEIFIADVMETMQILGAQAETSS